MTTTLLRDKFQALIPKKGEQKKNPDTFAYGRKIGFMVKLFGCRHGNISRPITIGKTAYRSCLNCGARRQFNPDTMESHGNFYFPPITKE